MFANFYRFVTNEDYSRETVFLGKKNKLQKLREEKEQAANKKKEAKQAQQSESEEEESDAEHSDDGNKVYKQVKHVFEIKVKELKNIPLLNKFMNQTNNQNEFTTKGKNAG